MNYNHTKRCAWCNKQFNSQREDAKFCSSTCRVRYHKEKNKKNNADEMFNDNVSNVSSTLKVLNLKKNVSYSHKYIDLHLYKDLEKIVRNKKSFLKFFLLAHKDEINEMAYELDLFTEEEYGIETDYGSRAIDILTEIEMNPNILSEKMAEIKELTHEFEEH